MRIRRNKLRQRLEKILSKHMNKKITIKKIKNIEIIEKIPSKTFNIARFKVTYKTDESNTGELGLVLKRLKPEYIATDFSNLRSGIHKGMEDPLTYTKNLFYYIQSYSKNGDNESALVKYYGKAGNDIFEEDVGEISLERLFTETTPNSALMKNMIKTIAKEHLRWEEKIISKISDLKIIKKENRFSEKLNYNISTILKSEGKELTSPDKEVLNKFFIGIDNYFNNPDCSMFIKLIHSDLHLGHIYLKYTKGMTLDKLAKMSKEDLIKEEPKIKVIDVTAMSIGPQTFDLVDILKHPVAINAEEYLTIETQRNFIEKLVKIYQIERVENLLDKLKVEVKNGVEIRKDLDFLTLFYISNIYRGARAATKGILLRSKPKNKELYQIYKELNPNYDFYSDWYLADLGETLRYLLTNKFKDTLKDYIDYESIEKSYNILKSNLKQLEENPIEISKKIIKY